MIGEIMALSPGRSLVAALALIGTAHAAPYTFNNIADTTGQLASIGPLVSLSNVGTLAFQAAFDAGGQAVLTGSGGPLTTISDQPSAAGARAPAINDAGTVAFVGAPGPGRTGIYTGNGGPVTTIADTTTH